MKKQFSIFLVILYIVISKIGPLSRLYNLILSSEALSQLAYNLFKFIDGFQIIGQLEKKPLKGLANVQEIFSETFLW